MAGSPGQGAFRGDRGTDTPGLRDHILPIRAITAPVVRQVVERAEDRNLGETTHRLVNVISQIMRYAMAHSRADNDPTPAMRGVVAQVPVSHRAAIISDELLKAFLKSAWAYPASPIVRAALLLQAMFFIRPGELRQMEWGEVDFDARLIRIGGLRMKGVEAVKKEQDRHLVPLARQALDLLRELHAITGEHRYVFLSARSFGKKLADQRPMSENTVNMALRLIGFDGDTVTDHGFMGHRPHLHRGAAAFTAVVQQRDRGDRVATGPRRA